MHDALFRVATCRLLLVVIGIILELTFVTLTTEFFVQPQGVVVNANLCERIVQTIFIGDGSCQCNHRNYRKRGICNVLFKMRNTDSRN
jgi:hypothetical protein